MIEEVYTQVFVCNFFSVCYSCSHTNAYYRHHEIYNVTWVQQKFGKYKDFQLSVGIWLIGHRISFFFSPIHLTKIAHIRD